MSAREPARPTKRLFALLAAAALALVTTPIAAAAAAGAAQADFEAGSGRADARVIRVGPSASRLSLAPSLSIALADYLGTVGRGEALIADFAALDGDVPPEAKEQIPPVRVTSTDENAAEGRSKATGPFRQEVRATPAPFGTSISSVDGFHLPGLVTIAGGRAQSWAGLVDDGGGRVVREAAGIVNIARADLGDGTVTLNGLHWEVRQRTDENDDTTPEVTGTFVIGSAVVGGERIDGPITGGAVAPLLETVNSALAPLGLQVSAPVVSDGDSVGRVSPLEVTVVDSEVGNTLLSPVLGDSQDLRDQIVTPLLEECLDCAALVLLADVTVGVLAGSGRLEIELGGSSAYTDSATFENPFAGGFDLPAPAVNEPVVTTAPPAPQPPDPPAAESSRTAPAPSTTAPQIAAPPAEAAPLLQPSAWITSLASAVWAVGIIAFGATVAMAIAEYRRIRSRQLVPGA